MRCTTKGAIDRETHCVKAGPFLFSSYRDGTLSWFVVLPYCMCARSSRKATTAGHAFPEQLFRMLRLAYFFGIIYQACFKENAVFNITNSPRETLIAIRLPCVLYGALKSTEAPPRRKKYQEDGKSELALHLLVSFLFVLCVPLLNAPLKTLLGTTSAPLEAL